MKTLAILCSALLLSMTVSSQCDVNASYEISDIDCINIQVHHLSTIDCPDAVYSVVKVKFGPGDIVNDVPLFDWPVDSIMYYDDIPEYTIVQDDQYPVILIEIVVNMYDAGFNLLGTDSYASLVTSPHMMVGFVSGYPATSCHSNDGYAFIDITNGTPPFLIVTELGTFTAMDDYTIYDIAPGQYLWGSITDANGCSRALNIMVNGLSSSYEGSTFSDNNGNSFWDEGEPFLGNQQLHLIEPDITVISNEFGQFEFPPVPQGLYHLEYVSNGNSYVMNYTDTMLVYAPQCAEVPLLPQDIYLYEAYPAAIFSENIHCVDGYNPGIYLHNTGSNPLNGIFSISFDPMFNATTLTGAVPFDTYLPGTVSWDIENLAPGASMVLKCHIDGPGIANIFENFPFTHELQLYDESNVLIGENTWIPQPLIVCGYDPNDKQAIPVGYTEDHYILPGDEIEYRIRFQNTGNAPAEDIVVHDVLDHNNLDLSTFAMIQSSHSNSVSLESNGTLDFTFNDINLPDSTSDEAGSQGYVVFRIRTKENVLPGTEINNTAQIFFDENPAIVTNTTWHTVFNCAWMNVNIADQELCAGANAFIDGSGQYIESHNWYINDVFYSSDAALSLLELGTGAYNIEHEMTNPLCTMSNESVLSVFPNPVAVMTVNGNVLSSSTSASYQWYLDGTAIDGATGSTYTVIESGDYFVQVIDEHGCLGTSQPQYVLFDDVENVSGNKIALFPNPMATVTRLQLPASTCDVRITDINGRLIHSWSNMQSTLLIDRNDMSAGIYSVTVTERNSSVHVLRMVVE